MGTYTHVPPVKTQAEFNQLLDDFKNWQAGFTPSGTFVSPYSFVIAKATDGGVDYYSASNAYQTIYGGSTTAVHHVGGVDGADAAAVIQAAIDAIGASGGKIFIRSASYPILRALEMDDYIELEGETYGYVGNGGTILTLEVADNLIEAHGTVVTHLIAPVLKNLFLNGNGRSYLGNAIDFEYVSNSFIDSVYIINFDGSAIKLSQAWNGVYRYLKIDDCGDLATTRPTIDMTNACADLYFESPCASLPHYTNVSISADSAAITFSSLIMEGAAAGNTYALLLIAGARIHITNMDVRGIDAGSSMIVISGDDIQITNSFLSGKGTLVNITVDADLVSISGCTFERYDAVNAEYGILAYGGEHTFTGNKFLYVNYGIWLATNAYGAITGNIQRFGINAIHLTSVSLTVTVTGNRALYTSKEGIMLDGADNCTLTGNIVACAGFGSGAASYNGIYLTNTSTYNVVTGNRCYDWGATTKYGLLEDGSSDNNTIVGNHFTGNTGGIVTNGASTKVASTYNNGVWIA